MLVVVVEGVGDEPSQLCFVPDDRAVQQFAAQCAEPPFDVTVRDRVGAKICVVAGQAALWYSLMRPWQRVDFATRRCLRWLLVE